MTCSEYVERFSDLFDGTASREVVREADEHLSACAKCRRYRHVFERGAELLRTLPAPEVHEDFAPRLQHRIYHVDQDEVLRRHTNSGATGLAVLGMAILLTAVAWAPLMRPSAPMVVLEPIVVNTPPPARARPSVASFSAFAGSRRTPVAQAGLWGDARTVLFEYSRLARRYGQSASLGRAGLEQDQ